MKLCHTFAPLHEVDNIKPNAKRQKNVHTIFFVILPLVILCNYDFTHVGVAHVHI